MRSSLASLALVLILPGCHIYFGGDDDDDDGCTEPFRLPLLNPETLTCEYPPQGGCNQEPYPLGDVPWASCENDCSLLSESACLAASSCRAAYVQYEVFDPTEWVDVFAGCYGLGGGGAMSGGPACSTLDVLSCSFRNDCAAVHESVPGRFRFCENEPAACDPTQVPPPPPPQQLRNPVTGTCETIGGGGGGGCDDGLAPPGLPDWGVCASPCEALDEASCKAADACRAIYANKFPPHVDGIELVYEACWPTAPSGPVHGGDCAGFDAQECSRHDDCVAQHASDWSACPDFDPSCDFSAGHFMSCAAEAAAPPPACTTLGEAACVARADCAPLYAGSDCTCTASGCTCDTWTFDTCHSR